MSQPDVSLPARCPVLYLLLSHPSSARLADVLTSGIGCVDANLCLEKSKLAL
jgi:hypothetical protein